MASEQERVTPLVCGVDSGVDAWLRCVSPMVQEFTGGLAGVDIVAVFARVDIWVAFGAFAAGGNVVAHVHLSPLSTA